jgi:hypothetical protein
MSTIVNTPGGGNGDSGAGFVIGVVVVIILIALFFLFILPTMRDVDTTPETINVTVPGQNNPAPTQPRETNIFNSTTTINNNNTATSTR